MSAEEKAPTVIIEELDAKSGKLGLLQLNAEKTLNSLSLEMVQSMSNQLSAWQDDNDIVAVILRGSGDKAFCAGGDVQQLYQSAKDQPGGPCEQGEAFFLNEYRLDYQIHCYPKPIICIGHGIVMGGGLGLMAGASHRIATETTRIAMPEITIGLFPDVGGTWFLSRMPRGLGIFFGLTGASINASDALWCRLADSVIPSVQIETLLSELQAQDWPTAETERRSLLDRVIANLELEDKDLAQQIPSNIQPNLSDIASACLQTSLGEIIATLNAVKTNNDWFNKAITTLQNGSPLSALIIYEQLRRYQYADLERVFLSEYQLATNVIRYPEFTEGVRALLIDKDKNPHWQFAHFSDVPASLLEQLFSAPWKTNPLAAMIQ